MAKKDPRIDAYIEKSQEFARPILKHLRGLVHKGCPEVAETIKWGFPHFDYKGIMCSMAAFKSHCTFGFWKGTLLEDLPDNVERIGETAMGQFGRITSLNDLPKESVMIGLIKQAATLNESGTRLPGKAKPKPKAKKLVVPEYLAAELKKNKKAFETFSKFSYTNQKEYVDWITEAKSEDTRNNRMRTALQWLSEGKIRNWKYVKKQN
jgi:uncharacterized protein YdeI (YjbR/CyaY-like superfamily)